MHWRIWKHKPYRDKVWHWRIESPEFPNQFNSFREAWQVLKSRRNDLSQVIIMPSFKKTGGRV
jgi:hypothetical protein